MCVCVCAHVRGRLGASVPRHTFPFVREEDRERGSNVSAKAEVEWRYQRSLVSTSPATGGSFISPACLLSYPIIMNMDVAVGSNGKTGKNTQVL